VIGLSINPTESADLAEGKRESSIATLARPGTETGWRFVVGNYDNIRAVTNAVGFHYTYDAVKDLINHPSGIVFLTKTGEVSSYILGANYTPQALTRDLQLAEQQRVGQKSEDIFFGCLCFDPATGKTSIAVMGVLRVAGLLTLVMMAVSFTGLKGKRYLARFRRRHSAA
jgi:protein SCO1/2